MLQSVNRPDIWDQLVDEERGRVSRRIFVDEAIHAREIEQIFNRCWLFVAHTTEIPNPGDYVTRRMGDDLVIVLRGDDRQVRVFLNVCPHRGALLTRADSGNCKHLVCPYHGWTFDNQGNLLTTTFDDFYQGKLDLAANGMTHVAQVDSYGGLIFATFDADAPSLGDYLGDARWYIDVYFNRTPGGMEVLAPPQRWVVDTNWKIGALNFGTDNQHLHPTHMGPTAMGLLGAPAGDIVAGMGGSYQISMDNGHGCSNACLAEGAAEFCGLHPDLIPLYRQTLAPGQLDLLRRNAVSVANIFPHLGWIQPVLDTEGSGRPVAAGTLRLWQPLGAHRMELTSWYLAEAEAGEAWRAAVLREGLRTFGVSGMFEEDDVDIWASITTASRGANARRGTMNFETALNFSPVSDYPGPGRAYFPMFPECQQFNLLRHWKALMMAGEA